jgi:hypothetical protein
MFDPPFICSHYTRESIFYIPVLNTHGVTCQMMTSRKRRRTSSHHCHWIGKEAFLRHVGLLGSELKIDFLSAMSGCRLLLAQRGPHESDGVCRITFWADEHADYVNCPNCVATAGCWPFPLALNHCTGRTLIINEGSDFEASTRLQPWPDRPDVPPMEWINANMTTDMALSVPEYVTLGDRNVHNVPVVSTAPVIRRSDGTVSSVDFLLGDIRQYPVDPTALRHMERHFPVIMSILEEAYDITPITIQQMRQFAGLDAFLLHMNIFARLLFRNTVQPHIRPVRPAKLDQVIRQVMDVNRDALEDAWDTILYGSPQEQNEPVWPGSSMRVTKLGDASVTLTAILFDIAGVLIIEDMISIYDHIHLVAGAFHTRSIREVLAIRMDISPIARIPRVPGSNCFDVNRGKFVKRSIPLQPQPLLEDPPEVASFVGGRWRPCAANIRGHIVNTSLRSVSLIRLTTSWLYVWIPSTGNSVPELQPTNGVVNMFRDRWLGRFISHLPGFEAIEHIVQSLDTLSIVELLDLRTQGDTRGIQTENSVIQTYYRVRPMMPPNLVAHIESGVKTAAQRHQLPEDELLATFRTLLPRIMPHVKFIESHLTDYVLRGDGVYTWVQAWKILLHFLNSLPSLTEMRKRLEAHNREVHVVSHHDIYLDLYFGGKVQFKMYHFGNKVFDNRDGRFYEKHEKDTESRSKRLLARLRSGDAIDDASTSDEHVS